MKNAKRWLAVILAVTSRFQCNISAWNDTEC